MNRLKNIFYLASGPVFSAIISFGTVPIITWLVSPEDMGKTTIFTLFQTMITSFIYLGLDHSFIREYNKFKNQNKTIDLLANALLIPGIICLILCFSLMIFQEKISYYFFSENNPLIIFFVVLWIPFVIIDRFIFLVIRMEEYGKIYSLMSIVSKVFVFLFTIILLLGYSKNYESIILGTIFSQILSSTILIGIYLKKFPIKRIEIDKNLINELLKFGLPMIPANLIVWGLNSSDRIILERYTTLSEIGVYFIALKLVATISIFQVIINNFWIPIAYKWNENKEKKQNYTLAMMIITMVMLALFLIIMCLKQFFIVVFGGAYSDAQYIFPFLLIPPIVSTIGEVTALGIAFSKKTYINIYISLFIFVVNIILNITLIPYIGAKGAAISTGLAYILFFIIRSNISRKLWYKFDLKFIYFNLAILFFSALINTFFSNVLSINILIFLFFILLDSIYIIKKQKLNMKQLFAKLQKMRMSMN